MESLAFKAFISLGLILLNGCFVLAEFALVRVRASRIELLARQGNQRAVAVEGILQQLDDYLSALQMGITMASLGLGWVGEPAVAALLEKILSRAELPLPPGLSHTISFAAAFGIITFTHIVVGELVPRSIGILKSDVVALWAAFPLKLFYLSFRLPISFMAGVSVRLLRLMRLSAAAEADTHMTEDEVRIILGTSEEKSGFSLERLMLIENIFDFGSAQVMDAMVPRDKIAFLSLEKPWEENLAVIRARRYSRYPLCASGLDTVTGYVHLKDLALGQWGAPAGGGEGSRAPGPDLLSAKREMTWAGPGDSLQKLLQSMADRGTPIALVRSDKGGVAGLVTLEDVVEEVVGEIHDEFDLPHAWSLMTVLVKSAVETGMDLPDREAVLRRLVGHLKAAHPALDAEEAMRLLLEREAKISSAVGHGVAIPHARLPALDRALVAVGRAPKAFPFIPPDKLPVRLIFLILTPAGSPHLQLRILARVASLVSNYNLRRRLLRARSAEHLVEILRTADTVVAV